MLKLLVSAVALFFSLNLYAQISMQDSTVQVVAYWSNNEQQFFDITHEKYKLKGTDTTSHELVKYEVEVTIKDSTANSYTIEWLYKNIETASDNPLAKKLTSIAGDIPVVLKSDEFGSINEVVNWKDLRDNMQKKGKALKKEMKSIPNADQLISQVMGMYMSKEVIEANVIKDVQQFYTFHGGKYTLGEEVTGQVQLMNNFGGKPFDTEVTVILDEINEEDGNSVIRMYQSVNPEQLTDATYDYLAKSGALNNQMPPRSAFPLLKNEIWTASRIHGGSGWIIYSIETKEVTAEGVTNIEERIIELK